MFVHQSFSGPNQLEVRATFQGKHDKSEHNGSIYETSGPSDEALHECGEEPVSRGMRAGIKDECPSRDKKMNSTGQSRFEHQNRIRGLF
jgi:hypothetical protein